MEGSSIEDDQASIQEAHWIELTRTWYISDETLHFLDLSLTTSIHGVLSLAGAVSNMVNMVIFAKLGLKNSMSLGLFALSLTDFGVTSLQVAICCSYLVQLVYHDCPVDPWTLGGYLFSWARYVAYLISCWITTALSVERCFCVVSPFTVRSVFTRTRCVLALMVIFFVHIAIHVPIFVFARLEWVPVNQARDDMTSSGLSVLTVVFNEESAAAEILSDMIAGIGLSVLSQTVLLICTLWMIFSLKSSSLVRQNAVSGSQRLEEGSKTKQDHLSMKERKMAKTVLFLALIVSVCNIPRFITTGVHHILPGMNRGAFQNLEKILWEISYFFGTACCTCNIFVYWKLNSNFRKMLKGISCVSTAGTGTNTQQQVLTMATVCEPHGASIPHFKPPAGNWMARQIRLAHDNSKEIVPASAPRSRGGREEKFRSLYKVDFPLHPVEVFLEKFEEKEKPKRLTIRDVLFGNSPTAVFGEWKIPIRLLKEASSGNKKKNTIPALVEPKKEEIPEPRPALQRQNSLPAIHITQPRVASCNPQLPKPVTSSAPPVRSKTFVKREGSSSLQDHGEAITEVKTSVNQLLKDTLQPHVANLAADWLKTAPQGDRKVIEQILRLQIKQNQLESAIHKTVLPDIRKKVQLWLETATEFERQVALKFFTSLAVVRNMGSNPQEQNIKIQQVVNTLEKGKGKVCQTARAPGSPVKESKLKYIQLLDPETRANRWMYSTWHHLPEYRDDNPVNNWRSHFTRPHAGTPRHFTIHPDWG
ncbi:hypothetical protein Btru_020919 [Bulinus truncatus]|nr:hypothetical protein Btru_020919 [Bulinus truncatus]